MKLKAILRCTLFALVIAGALCAAGCGSETAPTDATQSEVPTTTVPATTKGEPVPVKFDLEKDVLYFGRTYSKARIQWMNWSGSGFSIRFKGSSVAAEFYSNAPATKDLAYLKLYIDGVEQKDILLDKECEVIMLAEGLDPNEEHTIEVRKRTNIRSSSAGVGRIVLMDGTILEPEKPKERLIEFLGDSLTVGYVASKDGKTASAWSTTTEDVTKTYCTQIADAFDAEYQVVAMSGCGVVRNNGGDAEGVFPDIYREMDYYHNPGAAYDFAVQPDVIVINLGTNDESAANATLSPDVFRQGLYSFLKEVRQYNPDAHIVYAYGLVRVSLSESIESVVTQLRNDGDERIYYLQLEQCQSWELNLNHTVASAYVSRGEALIEKIEEVTGWKAGD